MKNYFTLGVFIVLFMSNITYLQGQSTEELDERHGFKDIKIGADFWDWNDKLEKGGSWPGGRPRYHYTGSRNYKVFDLGIEVSVLKSSISKLQQL